MDATVLSALVTPPSSTAQSKTVGWENAVFAVKGVAIIGVVLHHIGNRRLDPEALAVTEGIKAAFSWCVLVFVAVSGWLHGSSKQSVSRGFWEFVASRIRRLLLPFMCLVLLYSLAWEVIQASDLVPLRGAIPEAFLAKVVVSLWPARGQEVAEQLYFLPLLFFVGCPMHWVQRIWGRYGLAASVLISFVIASSFYRDAASTGFSLGTGIWALACYGLGLLASGFRHKATLLIGCLTALFIGVSVIDSAMIPKVAPALFLAVLAFPSFPKLTLIGDIGKASGTIYAYHTPFVLQPMVIGCSYIGSTIYQILGVVCAALASILICTAIFNVLERTRGRFVLM